MGRELRRVKLDFSWPLNTTWKGFICPYNSIDCKSCGQTGYNPGTRAVYESYYGLPNYEGGWSHDITQDEVQALVDGGRLMDFTHVPRTPEQAEISRKKVAAGGNSWLPKPNGYIPTAAEVNEWSKKGMGHDAINCGILVRTRAKRMGVYGLCTLCKGEGSYYSTKKIKKLAEAWKPTPPPKGPGYQLWETTSEGSPQSPVFKTLDALCEWASENATTFGSATASKEQWKQMLDDGFVHHTVGNMVFI